MNALHPCTLSQRAPFAAVRRVSPLCAAFRAGCECVRGRIQIGELYLAHIRQHCQLVEIVADGFLLPQDFLQAIQNHNAFSKTTGGHIITLTHMCLCCFLAYRVQILF